MKPGREEKTLLRVGPVALRGRRRALNDPMHGEFAELRRAVRELQLAIADTLPGRAVRRAVRWLDSLGR